MTSVAKLTHRTSVALLGGKRKAVDKPTHEKGGSCGAERTVLVATAMRDGTSAQADAE